MEKTLYTSVRLPIVNCILASLLSAYCQPCRMDAFGIHVGRPSLSLPLAPSRSGHDIGFPEITSHPSSSSGPASSAAASGVESPKSGTVAPVSG